MAKNKRIPDQLRMACELYVSGMSWKAIAEEMGRSVHTIRRWPERYPGMWNGYITSEFNISRERAIHDAVTAARIIIHNSEDKYRVPMIGHMLRYSSTVDKNFVDARRYRVDPNKEIMQNYSRSRDNYERELVAQREAKKAARGLAPAENASTNGHMSNAIVMGIMLLVGMALGNLNTMMQFATSAARGVASADVFTPKGCHVKAQGAALGIVDQRAPKPQRGEMICQGTIHHAPLPQGCALGFNMPPLRGEIQDGSMISDKTQGCALGFNMPPLRGETQDGSTISDKTQGCALGFNMPPLRGETQDGSTISDRLATCPTRDSDKSATCPTALTG